MTELQKTDFSARLIETNLDAGKVIWSKENLPSICFILVTGVILLSLETDLGTYHLKPGHFVGDFPYLVSGHSCKTALKIIEHSTVFAMDKGDFVDFLRSNPGLLVFFKDKYIVE